MKPIKVLVSWENDPTYCPPIKFSELQTTICRKGYETYGFFSNSVKISAYTPEGGYDLYDFLKKHCLDVDYDLIVVWSSSAKGPGGVYNQPRGLFKFDCPKLLILGDTHHMDEPIQTLLDYANNEIFTHIISIYDRQHLHFFEKNKFKSNLAWFPGLTVNHKNSISIASKKFEISLLGHIGETHPIRRSIYNELIEGRYCGEFGERDVQGSGIIYTRSLLNINVSLNGDLNLRNFEICMNQGMLLTEKISEESGFYRLFQPGIDCEVYGSNDELRQKIDYYLTHPMVAVEIAKNGYKKYINELQPKIMIRKLLMWIFYGELSSLHCLQESFRHRVEKSLLNNNFLQRVALYETLQKINMKKERSNILFDVGSSPLSLLDAIDLNRCQILLRKSDVLKADILRKINSNFYFVENSKGMIHHIVGE